MMPVYGLKPLVGRTPRSAEDPLVRLLQTQ